MAVCVVRGGGGEWAGGLSAAIYEQLFRSHFQQYSQWKIERHGHGKGSFGCCRSCKHNYVYLTAYE